MSDKDMCMVTPKSMEELTDIASKEHMVLFLNKAGCAHCHEMKPVLEEECKKNRQYFNFVNCPVEHKHCMDLAKAIEIGGVPYTAAIPRGKSVKDRAWEFTGFSKEIAGKLKSNLNKSVSAMQKSMGNSVPTPMPSPSPMSVKRSQVQRRDLPTDAIVLNTLHENQDSRLPYLPNTATFNAPKKVEICLPGIECSREEAEQKIIDFYLKW